MQLTRISIYPIKATREVSLPQADVRPRGLVGDRRWMVVDAEGSFLQQRVKPRLAVMDVQLQPDRSLVVTARDMSPLHVPVPAGDARRAVKVWRDTLTAADAGVVAAKWFSNFLGQECHLVFMDQQTQRPVDARYGRPGDVVSFADAAPLLLATMVSLEDLNRRLNRPLAMSRFRPNVTIDGDRAWEEDRWELIRIGQVNFEVTHRCARCVVTTIDQNSGQKDEEGEPLKTLATFRRDDGGVYFGQNLIPRTTGTIRVGDRVTVVRER